MRTTESISVVIPTYNVAAFIEPTLRSALAQTDLPDEVVVVDDGSIDATLAIVRRIAEQSHGLVHVVERPHSGPGATRNAGIAAARGTWIAFLDGDDLWLPGKIAQIREAIAADSAATIVTHPCIEVSRPGTELEVPLPTWYAPSESLLLQLYRGDFLWTSCVAALRRSILDVGGFDESLWSAQDYDLWLKLARRGRLRVVPGFLAKYNVRAGSVSSNPVLRCRALVIIAHRHAPHVRRVAGPVVARRMRVRVVLLAYHFVLTHLGSTRPGPLVRLVAGIPWQLLRAMFAPIR